MKVLHIESGLGNQMLSYCEYLALKKVNPDDDFYLETIIYDIPECNELICQWNGYELERIFGIKTPQNISACYSHDEWDAIMKEIRETEFWIHNWNYPRAFPEVMKKHGLTLVSLHKDHDPNNCIIGTGYQQKATWKDRLKASKIWVTTKRFYKILREDKYIKKSSKQEILFLKSAKNLYTGHWLSFKYRGNDRELIDEEIREVFKFPVFKDTRNMEMSSMLMSCNSVAIHARRGDMANGLAWCYKYGYFQRAVKLIRKNVKNPVFVFFTDPGSIDWCKNHEKTFGLNLKKDRVFFIDWNKGEESFRDMQLMACCKHAIITTSTFGWWGAYFIQNPNKITISPSIEIDTTHHC